MLRWGIPIVLFKVSKLLSTWTRPNMNNMLRDAERMQFVVQPMMLISKSIGRCSSRRCEQRPMQESSKSLVVE